jgi:hypothetical protein
MGLLETILSGQGGDIVGQISRSFNLDQGTTESAIRNMVPAISRGMQNNMSDRSGLESLLKALGKGNHQGYLDDAEGLSHQRTADDGNSILGHIFGNKDVSRNIAGRAATETGLSSSLLKKMLPVLASAAMGMMSRQGASSGLGDALSGRGSKREVGGLLTQFLDADNDGSITDDLLNLASKFF